LSKHRDRAREFALLNADDRIRPFEINGRSVYFNRAMDGTDSWVGVVGRHKDVRYYGRIVGERDSQGDLKAWAPDLVDPNTPRFDNPDDAMIFAATAASHRLDDAIARSRQEKKIGKASAARYDTFAEAIEPRDGRRAHRLTRTDLESARLLGEIVFTSAEIGRSLKISESITDHILEAETLDAARTMFIGRPSYEGATVETEVPNPIDRAEASEERPATATMTHHDPAGDVIFSARGQGRVTAVVDAKDRDAKIKIAVQKIGDGVGALWVASAGGRPMGSPKPDLPSAMTFAVQSARERLAHPKQHLSPGEHVALRSLGLPAGKRPVMSPAAKARMEALRSGDRDYRESRKVTKDAKEEMSAQLSETQRTLDAILNMPVPEHAIERPSQSTISTMTMG
jgi:hypothetical protein